jgi:hypothetical protein
MDNGIVACFRVEITQGKNAERDSFGGVHVDLGSHPHFVNLLPRGGFGLQLAYGSDALGVLDPLPVFLGSVSKMPDHSFLPLNLP